MTPKQTQNYTTRTSGKSSNSDSLRWLVLIMVIGAVTALNLDGTLDGQSVVAILGGITGHVTTYAATRRSRD